MSARNLPFSSTLCVEPSVIFRKVSKSPIFSKIKLIFHVTLGSLDRPIYRFPTQEP